MAKTTLFQKLINKNMGLQGEHPKEMKHVKITRIVIIVSTIALCSIFFSIHIDRRSFEATDYSIVPGYIWTGQTLTADFTFSVYKPQSQYLSDVKKARSEMPPVFILEKNIEEGTMKRLETMLESLTRWAENNDVGIFSERSLSLLAPMALQQKQKEIETIRRELTRFVAGVYKNGFIDLSLEKISHDVIAVKISPTELIYLKKSFLTDKSTFIDKAERLIAQKFNDEIKAIAIEITTKLLFPNLIFSEEQTEKALELAEKAVPRTFGIVRKGSTIIEKGEKATNEHIVRLQSYEAARMMKGDNIYTFWMALGSFGHAALIYSILILYLFYIRQKIFRDNVQLLVLSAMLVFICVLSWISIEIPSELPLEFLIFLPAFSMLSAIVFDSRTAFYLTVTAALMMTGIRGNDYTAGLSMIVAGTFAALTVRDIQNRTQMFKSIFFIFFGLLFPIIVFGLVHSSETSLTFRRIGMAAINAAVSPLITFGLIFILERVTNLTTDLRLQEYHNLSHPLLQKMSEFAPGTYQHTLSVANLAERCAAAIGANQLLIKVGTYFHDIGKLAKPEYFAENQSDFGSKHDLMSPKKSAAAIRDHVISGIELARQYKIPERIVDFIPMHHGTTLIKHFYAKALEESETGTVNDKDFRYPGPKPNTKEAAILMLCDSAEALSRVSFSSSQELEEAIDQNIKERILDGQFDECSITLQELQTVKETCLKSLVGISHQRVKYKELPKSPEKK